MQLFYLPNLNKESISAEFSNEESKHIFKVLRKDVGDNINITNGKAFNNENYTSYIHRSTDTTNSRYIYALGNTSTSTAKDIAYEWVSQKWVDIDTNATHNTFGNSVSDTANTSRETSANPQTVYVMETYWNLLYAVFTNPYYEA